MSNDDSTPAIIKEAEMMKDSILITTYVSLLDNISYIDLFGVSTGSYLLLAAIPEQLKYKNKKFRVNINYSKMKLIEKSEVIDTMSHFK